MKKISRIGRTINTLFSDCHETSSSCFLDLDSSWIQKKLRREVIESLNEQEGTWETYESMKYLTAVINESMRLRPAVAAYRRKVIQEDNILGYDIFADSLIIISPYVLHRKPEYWPDPETFNPDRFLEPGKSFRHANKI